MDRTGFESFLDQKVRENRFTISIVFPLVGALTLIGSQQGLLPEVLSFNPYFVLFGVLVMRSPLISGLLPILDRKAGIGVLAVCAYSYFIEFIGVKTGWPYGNFEYLIELGPMIAGEIPLGLPVFFLPLVLNSYLLTILVLGENVRNSFYRFFTAVSIVLIIDLVLDPGAVAVSFWSYETGIYYGVPVSNYLGWVLSSVIAVLVFDRAFDLEKIIGRLEDCEYLLDDMVSFVILWTIISVFYSLWIPSLIGVLIGLTLYRFERFNIPAPR